MKSRTIALLLFVFPLPTIYADEYIFQYHRFGQIRLQTDMGKEHIIIDYGEKESPVETIFESKLVLSGPGIFKTPEGTTFTLKHLKEPVINDGNRHINSGDWQLTVSGNGDEFSHLKPKLPEVAFGDTPPLVYLGEKAEQQ